MAKKKQHRHRVDVTCPYCGAVAELLAKNGLSTVSCESCNQQFAFDVIVTATATTHKIDGLGEVVQPKKEGQWIQWTNNGSNVWPKLEGDPLIHVKFGDDKTSLDGVGAQPVSYWHGDGSGNNFEWNTDRGGRNVFAGASNIIAYMILDENDHP